MGAADFLPERRNLNSLREAAAGCRGCHLYAPAMEAREAFTEDLRAVADHLSP